MSIALKELRSALISAKWAITYRFADKVHNLIKRLTNVMVGKEIGMNVY